MLFHLPLEISRFSIQTGEMENMLVQSGSESHWWAEVTGKFSLKLVSCLKNSESQMFLPVVYFISQTE